MGFVGTYMGAEQFDVGDCEREGQRYEHGKATGRLSKPATQRAAWSAHNITRRTSSADIAARRGTCVIPRTPPHTHTPSRMALTPPPPPRSRCMMVGCRYTSPAATWAAMCSTCRDKPEQELEEEEEEEEVGSGGEGGVARNTGTGKSVSPPRPFPCPHT